MTVCSSSAMGVVLAAAVNFQVRSVPTCRLRNSSGSRVLRTACPAARRRRSCCLVARVMCRPWPLAIRRALSSSRRPRSPHVITGSDARGEAAGPARRNLEESSKQSAMRPATESALLLVVGGRRGASSAAKTWHLFHWLFIVIGFRLTYHKS